MSPSGSNNNFDFNRSFKVVSVLIFLALIVFFTRTYLLNKGQFPNGDQAWKIILSAQVKSDGQKLLLEVPSPSETAHIRLFGKAFKHAGLRQRNTKADKLKKGLTLVSRNPGEFSVVAQYDIHLSELKKSLPRQVAPAAEQLTTWLENSTGIDKESQMAFSLVQKFVTDKPEPKILISRLFRYVSEHIRISKKGSDDGVVTLTERSGSVIGVNRALISLLRAAHIPSRLVMGLDVQKPVSNQPVYWTEAYLQKWQFLDPVASNSNVLYKSWLPLRVDDTQLFLATNAKISQQNLSIEKIRIPPGVFVGVNPSILDIFDLTRLAPDTRTSLGILMLLPFGILLTEILRQVLGVKTYGVFSPALLALAVVSVDWETALVLFVVVIVFGVAGSALLPKMGLSRTARLGVLFIFVALVMTLMVSLFNYFDPSADGSIVLLPIVILTTLADRIYYVLENSGVKTALIRMLWTFVAAFMSLMILLSEQMGEWLLTFPEIHLFTLSAIVLMGACGKSCAKENSYLGLLRKLVAEPVATKKK